MSERPSESRRSPDTYSQAPLPEPGLTGSISTAPDVAASAAINVSSGDDHPGEATGPSMGAARHPAKPHSPPIAEQPPSRTIGVRSILNPSQPETREEQSPTQQQERTLPSSSPRRTAPTGVVAQPTILPRSRKRADPANATEQRPPVSPGRVGRRVLTPISPALRASSLGSHRNPPAYAAGSNQAPFAHGESGRFYTAEPGPNLESDIPPLPTSTILGRATIPPPHTVEAATGQPRQPVSIYGHVAAPGPSAPRQLESPSTSQSSYGHVSQASPLYRYNAPHPSQHDYPPTLGLPVGYQLAQHAYGPAEAPYSMPQGSYQMTLDTEHGPMTVPVELDLQQASKSADERRKRNAGASARFRARRKEKEKEASVTIASLEQDIRELEDERDFYQNERNFFRDYAMRTVGHGQLPVRPPSPQPRRLLEPQPPLSEGPSESEQSGPQAPTRSQRRRTGDYQPSFGSARPSASPMMPPQHPVPPAPYLAQGQLPPMQGSYADRPGPPGLPPPPGLPVTRSHSYDNFRPHDPFNRSWPPR